VTPIQEDNEENISETSSNRQYYDNAAFSKSSRTSYDQLSPHNIHQSRNKTKRSKSRNGLEIEIPYLVNAGDLSFGILIIWKLHQVHFVFFFIVLGH